MRRGEVWWIQSLEGRRRPVVVLTRDSAIPVLRRICVAPITTTIRGIPTEVRLGVADGMKEECVVALDNVRTIPKPALRRRLTSLSARRLDEICDALTYALGCR